MNPMSYRTYVNIDVHLREGVKKKLGKRGRAARLGGGEGGSPPPQPDHFYL